jgi:hypothetical protein
MDQAAIRALLGLEQRGATIRVNPCIPAVWPQYTLEWRLGRTRYRVTVSNPDHQCRGIAVAELDGLPVDADAIGRRRRARDDDRARPRTTQVLSRREHRGDCGSPRTASNMPRIAATAPGPAG